MTTLILVLMDVRSGRLALEGGRTGAASLERLAYEVSPALEGQRTCGASLEGLAYGCGQPRKAGVRVSPALEGQRTGAVCCPDSAIKSLSSGFRRLRAVRRSLGRRLGLGLGGLAGRG
jgi:hypothetical protein